MSEREPLTEIEYGLDEHTESYQVEHRKEINEKTLLARIRVLETDNLRLRQDLDRLKRQKANNRRDRMATSPPAPTAATSTAGTTAATTMTTATTSPAVDDPGTLVKQPERSAPDSSDVTLDKPIPKGRNTFLITQSQSEALAKLKDRIPTSIPKQNLTQAPSKQNDSKESLTAKPEPMASVSTKEKEAMATLESITQQMTKMMSTVDRRLDILESKTRELSSIVNGNMNNLTQQIAEILQAKEKTFQVSVMSPAPLVAKKDVPVNHVIYEFCHCDHFSGNTCVYTCPETGLYEFYVRWRQTGGGQIRVTLHWEAEDGENKFSPLGQTTADKDVQCPMVRRWLEKGEKVWLGAQVMAGKPELGSCDFGGSPVLCRAVTVAP